ncbi:hypothetical protein ACFLTE_01660 [Bacteroidota bacterium]
MKKVLFILSIAALVAFISAPVVAHIGTTDNIVLQDDYSGDKVEADSSNTKTADTKSCGKVEKKGCCKPDCTKPCCKKEEPKPSDMN